MIKDHDWSEEGIHLVKALAGGASDEHTRQRAIDHIVHEVCGFDDIPLIPGSPEMTGFNAGKQWVARQILIATTTPVDQLRKQEDTDERTTSRRIPTATERAATSSRRSINRR